MQRPAELNEACVCNVQLEFYDNDDEESQGTENFEGTDGSKPVSTRLKVSIA
jgi:hypothetical protein